MNRYLRFIANHLIKESIVFESVPFLSDNTKPVYDEIRRRGYGKKYNLIWHVANDKCAIYKNGKFYYWNPQKRKKLLDYSFYRAKCYICCNYFLPSSEAYRKTNHAEQTSFYLTHGTPMKSVRQYYSAPKGIDYTISPAPAISHLIAEQFNVPEGSVYATGFPRNDVFAKPVKHLNQVLGREYKKVIIWYPTYRQNKSHSIDLSSASVPLLYKEENVMQLNEACRAQNVLLIIKPHFAQDVSLIKKIDQSNILLIDDSFFLTNNITSYEFLAGSDALITDYSSVYFDYTLHDRPIAVIWEDFEEYKKFPGFAMDINYYLKGAEKVYTIDELCAFVIAVANEEDRLQKDRREIRDVCNMLNDGQNTRRVVDFIVKTAKL